MPVGGVALPKDINNDSEILNKTRDRSEKHIPETLYWNTHARGVYKLVREDSPRVKQE